MNNDLISRQAAIDALESIGSLDTNADREYARSVFETLPSAQPERKSCKTCHLWEDGELNIACPWGSNYEHYEDDYCSLWEKQN